MTIIDFAEAGVPEWEHPATAACVDLSSMKRLQACIVCTMLALVNDRASAVTAGERREAEERFREVRETGIILASLMRAETER